MKKLVFIILAVVSMALVSCEGGSEKGITLADPAIHYYHNIDSKEVDITNCLLVKNLDVKEENDEIVVSAQFEMVKEPEAPIQYVVCSINLLDENENKIASYDYAVINLAKEGEIANLKKGLNLKNLRGENSIDDAFNKAKFVMFDYVKGQKIGY